MNIEKVKELAAIVHEKRETFKAMGLQNTTHLSGADRVLRFQEYEAARAEMWKAEADLIAEQRS